MAKADFFHGIFDHQVTGSLAKKKSKPQLMKKKEDDCCGETVVKIR